MAIKNESVVCLRAHCGTKSWTIALPSRYFPGRTSVRCSPGQLNITFIPFSKRQTKAAQREHRANTKEKNTENNKEGDKDYIYSMLASALTATEACLPIARFVSWRFGRQSAAAPDDFCRYFKRPWKTRSRRRRKAEERKNRKTRLY